MCLCIFWNGSYRLSESQKTSTPSFNRRPATNCEVQINRNLNFEMSSHTLHTVVLSRRNSLPRGDGMPERVTECHSIAVTKRWQYTCCLLVVCTNAAYDIDILYPNVLTLASEKSYRYAKRGTDISDVNTFGRMTLILSPVIALPTSLFTLSAVCRIFNVKTKI